MKGTGSVEFDTLEISIPGTMMKSPSIVKLVPNTTKALNINIQAAISPLA
jgi:hypothetical protein